MPIVLSLPMLLIGLLVAMIYDLVSSLLALVAHVEDFDTREYGSVMHYKIESDEFKD
ncbi:MAG: hypothetical protein VKL39_23895 [Leptolyngbyaceae bacterium]|nr:hypothetical protein [Leptolyngbyaceae bacterium]